MKFNMFSNAFNLALHSMVLLTQNTSKALTTAFISEQLNASSNHLAKVHTRLVRHGFVKSTRGPSGGLTLAVPPDSITIMDIFRAIEGPLEFQCCVFGQPVCNRSTCIMGSFLNDFNSRIKTYFDNTRLSDLVEGAVEIDS
jgi:Rrf2 family transcriptional regulator, nitric oxide-sensitive transcriptional repressor